MRIAAFFDFDGTLFKRDSLLEFTRFCKGNMIFALGMICLMPRLILMKIGILDNEKTKQKYFRFFFGGMTEHDFRRCAERFASQKIHCLLDTAHYSNFQKHLGAGHEVFIVTASPSEWIAPWSRGFGVQVIGTNLEILDGKLTGNFASANCYGREKVARISAVINTADYDAVYVYGSGRGDREMLTLRKNCQAFS